MHNVRLALAYRGGYVRTRQGGGALTCIGGTGTCRFDDPLFQTPISVLYILRIIETPLRRPPLCYVPTADQINSIKVDQARSPILPRVNSTKCSIVLQHEPFRTAIRSFTTHIRPFMIPPGLSSTTTSISTRTYRSIHDQYTINKWSILELY